MRPDLVSRYLRWSCTRAACARGYWVVTALYLVVVADLEPLELVLLGTAQGLTVVLAEVPAGVLADTVSRKWSLVVGHVVSGAGMVLAGLVTSFPAELVAQSLWGLGWAFMSGADVAWITDELDRPDRIDRVLAAAARWELTGALFGLLVAGAVAWAAGLSTAIVASGVAMATLGGLVAVRFPEHRFVPAGGSSRWRASRAVLVRGVDLARRDRQIFLLLVAWPLVNGAGEGFGRLRETRLVGLGFADGAHPIVWFALLSLVALGLGALALRAVELRIDGADVARRTYLACCAVGVVGLLAFAHAPDARWAVVGALLMGGIARPVISAVAAIWVNRRTTSDVRATVHSLLSQAEHLGEITFGVLLALVARTASTTAALVGSAVLLAGAGLLVSRAIDPVRPGAAPAGRRASPT